MSDYYRNKHYTGIFNVSQENMMGELVYNKQEGSILLYLKREYDTDYLKEESYGRIDVITGKLNSGHIVTLFDNKCVSNRTIVPSYHEYQFTSSRMIWGGIEKTEPLFNKFVFTLENALEWSGLNLIDDDYFNGLKIKDSNPSKTFEWFGATITFQPCLNSWNHYPRREKISIIQRLEIIVDTQEKKGLDFFISIRDRIISMIEFAIKGNINIEKQYAIDLDEFYELLGHKNYAKYYVYTNDPIRLISSTHSYKYNFKLTQLGDSCDYNEILTKLSPVLNLYLSLFKYSDMPIEMVFLNIVQALETFHARFFYNNNVKNYIRAVYEKYGESPNFEEIKKILLPGKQEESHSISLASRINELMFNSKVRLFYHYYVGKNKEFTKKVVNTRHYYTHYNEKREEKALKGKELYDAITVISLLLEYNICLALGVDNTEKVQDELRTLETWRCISHIQNNKEKVDNLHNKE